MRLKVGRAVVPVRSDLDVNIGGEAAGFSAGGAADLPNECVALAAHVSEDLCERFRIKHMFDFLDARM
jgi:hypothetical protein